MGEKLFIRRNRYVLSRCYKNFRNNEIESSVFELLVAKLFKKR